jgi:hypothetical protein
MSEPARAIVPVETVRAPVTSLKSVLLPAPLGPMSACRAPAGTSRLTSSTAFSAPKARPTPDNDSSVSLI